MSSLPNMVIDGSVFLGNEMTYLRLFQDVLILASYVALSWNLYWRRNPTGISSTSQLLYAITFSLRLTEHYPFDHCTYDLASSGTFAALFAISLILLDFATNRLSSKITTTSAKDRLCLHTAVGGTAVLASFLNYNHLPFSGKVFCLAWSHYLNGVAVLPQLWALFHLPPAQKANDELLSLKLFSGVNLMSMARIFEMLHWTYMKYEAEMFDPLAYYSALFHLVCMLLFRLIYAYKRAGNVLLA